VQVRALKANDVAAVVAVHRRAFPEFFLSFLGPRFLRGFYGAFLVDSLGLGFVAVVEGGRVLGVVVALLDPSGYFKRLLKRRWWAFCLTSVSAVLRPAEFDSPAFLRASGASGKMQGS